jgi:hypothetical protein
MFLGLLLVFCLRVFFLRYNKFIQVKFFFKVIQVKDVIFLGFQIKGLCILFKGILVKFFFLF